ncbi:hypothetical protein [Paenibacillus sp. SN-8-1]|uniref:hypothetical protein n=1 Tax=Paenibacillus sp. SN-8-1 TaxID=3435409 RepID=UPI003D9A8BCF
MDSTTQIQNHGGKKKGSFGFLAILIVIAIILAATNPSKEDFTEYVVDHINVSSSSNNAFAAGMTNLIGKPILSAMTARDNYTLFSVFTINDGMHPVKVIGMFNDVYFNIEN